MANFPPIAPGLDHFEALPTIEQLTRLLRSAPTVPADLSPDEPSRYECHIFWADGTDDYENACNADELYAYLSEHLGAGEPVAILCELVITDDPDHPALFEECSLRNLRLSGHDPSPRF